VAKARRTEAAERDLEGIAYYIAIDNGRPETAVKVLRELVQRCDDLAGRARMATEGTPAPRIGRGVRLAVHKRWVILFRYDDDGIVVLRIADGNQEYLSWKLDRPDDPK
jgi:plasmid stabilization system protein ParE